jgi:hypothetical protein
MPKYERRVNAKPVERIEAREGGHEDTRLGLAAEGNKPDAKSGWVRVDEWPDAAPKAPAEAGR